MSFGFIWDFFFLFLCSSHFFPCLFDFGAFMLNVLKRQTPGKACKMLHVLIFRRGNIVYMTREILLVI